MTLAIKKPKKEIPFQNSDWDKARPKQHVPIVGQPSTRKEFPERQTNHGSHGNSDASTNQPRFPCVWDFAKRLGHLAVKKPSVGAVAHEFDTCKNCQRWNLRTCSNQKNQCNRRKHRGSSQFKGVCWHKRDGKFQAEIKLDGRSKFLGMFTDELDAALAYDSAAREHFGEFACCNFPLKKPCTKTSLALESQHGEYAS